MKRTKLFVVMVGAVLAMSALIGAAAASAADRSLSISGPTAKFAVTSTPPGEAYPAFIKGTNKTSAVSFEFSEELDIECSDLDLLGYRSGPSRWVQMGISSFDECSMYEGGMAVSAAANNCQFKPNLEGPDDDLVYGGIALDCEAGKGLELTVTWPYLGEICTVKFASQRLSDALYFDVPSEGTVWAAVPGDTELSYELVHLTGAGPLCGEEGFHSDGSFAGAISFEAMDENPF